jgi:hypothetical protein
MKFNGRTVLFTFIMIAIATACKFFFGPNLSWSGFSPVIAIALLSGMLIKDKRQSFILPLVALFVSDVLIQLFYQLGIFPYAGFYNGQLLNYAFLLIATFIGWALSAKKNATIFGGAIIAPVLYFLVSNFSVWATGANATYGNGINGLLACYTAGLPFLRNSIGATILFLPIILAVYNYIVQQKRTIVLA